MVRGGAAYLFYGEEDFLKKEASEKIISSCLNSETRKLNYDVYSAKDNYADILTSLKSLPFLSDKRVILVRDVETFPEFRKKELLESLKKISNHLCIIFHTKKPVLSDGFLKDISTHAETTAFKKLDTKDVRFWIQKRLSIYKKGITRDALGLITELKGDCGLTVLSGELDKLVAYKGEAMTITKEDVFNLIGRSVNKRVFDLVKAIRFKDKESALSLLKELLSDNRKGIPEILGLIGWNFRNRWSKEGRRKNTNEFKEGLKLLLEADRSVKIGRAKAEFILEQLVIRLCSA